MSSIGALLDHLVRQRAVGELDDEGLEGLEIRDIEALTLLADSYTYLQYMYFLTKLCSSDQVMQINADALLSVATLVPFYSC